MSSALGPRYWQLGGEEEGSCLLQPGWAAVVSIMTGGSWSPTIERYISVVGGGDGGLAAADELRWP